MIALEELLESATIAAAARELLAVFEEDDVFTAVAGLQLLDLANVGDDRAVNADEKTRSELLKNGADALAHHIAFFSAVDADIVGGGLNPINLIYIEKNNAATGPDDQPFSGGMSAHPSRQNEYMMQ